MILLELFQYDFVWRAYAAVFCISIVCAILGNFVVLGRMSSLGDAISHISFGAISVSISITDYPTALALIFVIFSSIILDILLRKGLLHGESAVSIVSLFAISVGIISSSTLGGSSVNLSQYLFGSALVLSTSDLLWIILLFVIVFILVWLLYGDFLHIVCDVDSGRKKYSSYKNLCGMLFKIIVSVTIFCAAKFLGAILVSSLLIVPPSIAMKTAGSFRKSLLLSVSISAIIGILGLTFAMIFSLPIGATIALLASLLFIFHFFNKKK